MFNNQEKKYSPLFIVGALTLILSFVWISSNLSLIYEYENFKIGSGTETKGMVLSSEWTRAYDFISYVHEYEFEFYTEKNEYIVGRSFGISSLTPRDTVVIQYSKANPDLSRIKNTKHRLATRPDTKGYLALAVGIVLIIVSKFVKPKGPIVSEE